MPSKKLDGKQMTPVNGMGSQPVQNVSRVNTAKTRLRMDFGLRGNVGGSSFESIG
jgi:hypothetical protein